MAGPPGPGTPPGATPPAPGSPGAANAPTQPQPIVQPPPDPGAGRSTASEAFAQRDGSTVNVTVNNNPLAAPPQEQAGGRPSPLRDIRSWGTIPKLITGVVVLLAAGAILKGCGGSSPSTTTTTVVQPPAQTPTTTGGLGSGQPQPRPPAPSGQPPVFVPIESPDTGGQKPTAQRQVDQTASFAINVLNNSPSPATSATFRIVSAKGKAISLIADSSSVTCGDDSNAAVGIPDPAGDGMSCSQVSANQTASLIFNGPASIRNGRYHVEVTANGDHTPVKVPGSTMTLSSH